MIKQIIIENYKGIKKRTVLDFKLNHLKPSQIEKENTFIIADGTKAMAVPTLIAKNASGKTSILDAIVFADKINSIEDTIKYVTEDLDKFQNTIEKVFKTSVMELQRFVSEETSSKDLLEIIYIGMSRVARDLGLGEIFNSGLMIGGVTPAYLKEGMIRLEEKIFGKAEKIISHIKTNLYDYKTKDIVDMNIRIDYSNGRLKDIRIGKITSFNGQCKNLDDILAEAINHYEFTGFISQSFADFNGYYLYAVGEYTYDMANTTKIAYGNSFGSNRLSDIDVAKSSSIKLINDDEIRSQISAKTEGRDWGGESLINNFVTNYGVELSSNIIKAIDGSIDHIVGSKEESIWKLKDSFGVIRPASALSFGTFKTIYILNRIYFSWQEKKVLLIDEIENGLNISLIDLIIRFATNEKFAKDGFQMIVTTHNPTIFDQGVINPQNAFVNITGTFERLIDNKELISRSEDLDKVFASKNYFNEFYWLKSFKKPGESSHTIIKDSIFELLDEVEENLL